MSLFHLFCISHFGRISYQFWMYNFSPFDSNWCRHSISEFSYTLTFLPDCVMFIVVLITLLRISYVFIPKFCWWYSSCSNFVRFLSFIFLNNSHRLSGLFNISLEFFDLTFSSFFPNNFFLFRSMFFSTTRNFNVFTTDVVERSLKTEKTLKYTTWNRKWKRENLQRELLTTSKDRNFV